MAGESGDRSQDRFASRGMAELLAVVGRLIRRPRRGETELPIVVAIGASGTDIHQGLLRRLRRPSRRRVPHVEIDAALFADDHGIRPLLDAMHHQLALDAFGAEPFAFRHYPLARWLMDQRLTDVEVTERRSRITQMLRDWRRRPAADSLRGASDAETAFATAYRLVLWLVLRAVPDVLFRAALSGRLPVIGGRYRWFMRQQYLAPRQSGTFIGFAERLTTDQRTGEQPEQVRKLLVHAFLEDLRAGYARRVWSPTGWRRTAYPVLLLDNVAPGNAGHALLRLVNDVRNETGRWDPLLIVADAANGYQPVDGAGSPLRLAEVGIGLDDWRDALPEQRRLRRADAWFLALGSDPDRDDRYGHPAVPDLVPPAPPWWARRSIAAALVLVLLAGALVWASGRWGPGCLPHPTQGEISLRLIDGECIGYSDNAGYVFNNDPGQEALRGVQERIFRQNEEVMQVWQRSQGRRPLMTLVYLGIMTGQRTGPREVSYVSEREELEGMAVAQYERMKMSAGTDGKALIRIVIANGGKQMRHAVRTVDLLAGLARRDPTVMGVIGLVESRTTTAEALKRLHRIGLPAIAPTLSADGFHLNSGLYLQMVAPNADQARLVATYATEVLEVDEAHIYYTTGDDSPLEDDLYVSTLVSGLTDILGSRARDRPFRFGDSLADECGYQGMLFFAGRYSEFDEFLEALRQCRNNPPLHLVADDSVNRYLANHQLRASAPGNLPVTYVSKAALATCSRLIADAERDESRRQFLDLIRRDDLLGERRCVDGTSPPVGERVALAYDASRMLIEALEELANRMGIKERTLDPRSVSPVTVFTQVLLQNAQRAHNGVTGPIRFDPQSGEPREKRLSLMYVPSVPQVDQEPQEIFFCGRAQPDDPPGCHGASPLPAPTPPT
ncbi:hypothetical protein [Micromonospora sp. NBC_01813]|uniref:hypothetical protein n=1 Tax=Micromonospora sp. NBC_01813 TaxID=2975988 RepID=UPI002DD84A08|nr:hypothetical protein [Micromonospora sp. NBC_01813]WSA10299.1 hypothetical protein OG958_05755 [Micromonospora sp. NBC_01813]